MKQRRQPQRRSKSNSYANEATDNSSSTEHVSSSFSLLRCGEEILESFAGMMAVEESNLHSHIIFRVPFELLRISQSVRDFPKKIHFKAPKIAKKKKFELARRETVETPTRTMCGARLKR